ncbi:hypothetical protein TKWG_20095 [Advenella kashmirensis WT001]|uniref:Uncharacterized protein n=1 Tax=Advenella kashmirensis (strain DSM 17095 / LMG 22695 / WT001) TaxID=1036672 RepID=I3UFK3_ADVKW|nr:hypothetical protein [Advenella kashmirensis]AFK63791.1 hypothetical protein TKWG_20095 [Advenella kashmirensis WT001]
MAYHLFSQKIQPTGKSFHSVAAVYFSLLTIKTGQRGTNSTQHTGNVLLIRGAYMWILMLRLQAWRLVGTHNQVGFLPTLFPEEPTRVLQVIK